MFSDICLLLIVCEFYYINQQIVKNCLFNGKIHVENEPIGTEMNI